MNLLLLERIANTRRGLLVTLVRSEGHTYKRAGDKALYEMGDPFPVYGNLGSACVDQDILRHGREACDAGKPRVITVDTSEVDDIHFGSGTYCGGVMELLLEPVLDEHKAVYEKVRGALVAGRAVTLRHDTRDGTLSVVAAPSAVSGTTYEETLPPPRKLCLFGATPLARHIVEYTSDMNFALHVIDWRPAYLELFNGDPRVAAHEDDSAIDRESLVLLLSHNYERDKSVLRRALEQGCSYVGMLSSRTRRDRLFDDIAGEGISREYLERVSCPVGIPVGAHSDAEIAISIVAELVEVINR